MRTDDRNTLVILDRKTGKPIKGKSVRYEEKDNMEVVGGEWLSDDIYQYDVTFEIYMTIVLFILAIFFFCT